MYCPKCKCEYVEGIESCSDCGERLVSELPKEEKEDLIFLMNFEDQKEAYIVKSLLSQHQIEAVITNHYPNYSGRAFPFSATYRNAQLFVQPEQFDSALEVLSNYSKKKNNGEVNFLEPGVGRAGQILNRYAKLLIPVVVIIAILLVILMVFIYL